MAAERVRVLAVGTPADPLTRVRRPGVLFLPPGHFPLGLDTAGPAVHSFDVQGWVTIPLRTGRRWDRSRAEHARTRRVASWRRRRQRRHGIPADRVWRRTLIPRAVAVDVVS